MYHPSNPKSLLRFMKINIKHDRSFVNASTYHMKTTRELLMMLKGISYEQIEYERYVFERLKYQFKTYIAYVTTPIHLHPNHSFLIYQNNNECYWFENDWEELRGIHGPFKTYDCVLTFISNQFIRYKYWNNINIYEYEKPRINTKHMMVDEYINFIFNNRKIGDIWTRPR